MYIPNVYQVEDREQMFAFMAAHNFATLVTVAENVPFATHLPVLVDESRGTNGVLSAHMARANPQWKHFVNGQEVLVIFQGPHAYVSPAWYTSEFAVPTWNYMTVHAYGQPRLIEDEATVQQMVTDLVDYHEAPRVRPWSFTWTERHLQLLKGIVAFEVVFTRLEGKAKLSQNRSHTDQVGVIQALKTAANTTEQQVAAHMTANLALDSNHNKS